MKIDLTTILGMVLSLGGLGAGYMIEGGSFGALLAISPILIIFGGTIGVVLITQPASVIKQVPKLFKILFTDKQFNYLALVDQITDWAKLSRKEGIVALDTIVNEIKEPFIQKGLKLVVDSVDQESVKELLENEISAMEGRHRINASVFESAGGFAPTMGIIGTVLGLITILSKLGGANMNELGHGIATAFLATLMGVGFANLICLPFGNKLKSKSAKESLYCEIALQGILAIQAQESPILLKQRLLSLLPDYQKARQVKEGE